MADNVTLNAGSGGSVLRTKDHSGIETSIVGLDLNPAGSEVLMAGAMPVTGTFWQATQPISGTVAATQSGTWNVTTVAALTAITNALPAGTNLLGQISASDETATIYSGTTALTPKFAKIVASASGATEVVAAVGGKRIRVLRWSLSSNGDVNVKWQSHFTPTDLTGLHYLTQFASAGGSYCPVGIFQTVSGEALDINLSGSVAVGGELVYVEV